MKSPRYRFGFRQDFGFGIWDFAVSIIISKKLNVFKRFSNPQSEIRIPQLNMIGTTINQYKILEKLGAGGQGTVYKARDTKLDRTVVIKVLPPELTAKTANFKRFEREAQL
jgi:serine/threonine protein kinase